MSEHLIQKHVREVKEGLLDQIKRIGNGDRLYRHVVLRRDAVLRLMMIEKMLIDRAEDEAFEGEVREFLDDLLCKFNQ